MENTNNNINREIDYKVVAKEMMEKGYSIRQMAKIIGKSKTVVHYHLQKIEDEELKRYLTKNFENRGVKGAIGREKKRKELWA